MSPEARPLAVLVAREARELPGVLGLLAARSIAASKSSSVKFAGSLPIASSIRPTVSRISVSRVTFPLIAGSVSSWSMLSIFLPPVAFGL